MTQHSQPTNVPAEANAFSAPCCTTCDCCNETYCGHTSFVVDEVKACGTTGKVCMLLCCVDLVARTVLRLLQDHDQSAEIRKMIHAIIFEELYVGQRVSGLPKVHVAERGGVSYITIPSDNLNVDAEGD
ncbi:hypothetical protein C8R48DRAFT_677751 [Suillus tomentosus]|nr:hypothetical protein C8R48DRAFT_677751 [Suillus tomentosus]